MNTAFNPFPSLPFGTQRQRPGASTPFDPAGPMWNGLDPTKANLGIPTRRPTAVYELNNPFGVPIDTNLMGSATTTSAPGTQFGGFGQSEQSQDKTFSSPSKADLKSTPYARDTRPKSQFAEGGTVRGPGGPTADKVPAVVGNPHDPRAMPVRLSNGEEIVNAQTRDWFGKKFFVDLARKAAEGMKGTEDADERTEPHGMADRHEDMAEGEMDDPEGYARGGTMKTGYATGGTISNPYADDPMLYAQRQQEARDAALAADGVRDLGRGNMVLSNRYGTGYSTPTATPQTKGRFEVDGGAATVTPGKGAQMMPDVVPASNPWAAPALPFDRRAVKDDIAFTTKRLEQGAELRRSADLMDGTTQAALMPKGRREITVPNANPFPNGTPSLADFQAPWEKDEARRASQPSAQDRRIAREWSALPGTDYMVNKRGNALPMTRATQPMLTPEAAAAMGLQVKSVDSKGNPTYAPQPQAKTTSAKVHSTKEVDGVLYNVMSDGSMTRAVIEDPSPQMKLKAFTAAYKREPKSAEDWSEAYYLASGKARPQAATQPAAAPAATPGGKPFVMTAKTSREELARLPAGTPVQMPDGSIKYKR